MTLIETISLLLSATVIIVAGITAFINYLNYKAITTFTLYLRAETKSETVDQKTPWLKFPDRISRTLILNGAYLSNPQTIPITVRWFDLILGNTGPGVARKVTWKVQYSPEDKNRDSNDMHSQEKSDLGPQANAMIVSYIPRDYSLDRQQSFFSSLTKLPNPTSGFPWVVEVCYEIPRVIRKNLKVQEEYSILADGTVQKKILGNIIKKKWCAV